MSNSNFGDNFSNPFPSISMSQHSFNELNPLNVDSSHSFPFISDHQYASSSIPVMTPNHSLTSDHLYALSSIPVMSPNHQAESNYEQNPYPPSKIPSIIFDSAVPPYVDPNMPVPILQNVVSTASLDVELNLHQIAAHALNAEYNPKRFSALIMRIREPKTTALIFNNGKIVCTGAKSAGASHLAARKFGRIIQKLGYPDTKFGQFKVQNIVCSCDLKFKIQLEALALVHFRFCTYEPELFPGLVYRMLKPRVVMLIFHSGKMVLTGAKKKEDIDKGFRQIYPVLKQFKR